MQSETMVPNYFALMPLLQLPCMTGGIWWSAAQNGRWEKAGRAAELFWWMVLIHATIGILMGVYLYRRSLRLNHAE